jgi:hypothetical protein
MMHKHLLFLNLIKLNYFRAQFLISKLIEILKAKTF